MLVQTRLQSYISPRLLKPLLCLLIQCLLNVVDACTVYHLLSAIL